MKHAIRPPRCLNELLASAAPSAAERDRRWTETRRIVLEICPHLIGDLLDELSSRDLRIVCSSLDLVFFHGAFGSTFEREINPVFCWRVEEIDMPAEAVLEYAHEDNNHYFHVHVSRPFLKRQFADPNRPVMARGHVLRDPLDAVLGLILLMMLRGIAIGNTESRNEAERLDHFLLERLFPLGLPVKA